MSENDGKKSAQLYERVKLALLAGRYLPGHRIDPATLAKAHKISPTPVRFGLYRLIGEGLLADHGRSGLFVPLPNEVSLHDLYDWIERLLAMACKIGVGAPRDAGRSPSPPGGDVVQQTWELFDAIAAASGQRSLHGAVVLANDRLAPVRRAKHGVILSISDAAEELLQLQQCWLRHDARALAAALAAYHARRKALVPRIVALLNDCSEPSY